MEPLKRACISASAAFLLLLSSCQPIYRPTVVNQPMVSGKGDIQASGHIGTNGTDVQLAGAVSDHIVLIGDYNRYSMESEDDSTSGYEQEHRSFEFGGGYYTHIGEGVRSSDNSGGVIELIGGYGNGKASHYSDVWTHRFATVTGQYHKFFFQPGIAYHHEIFDGGFTSRLTGIDYYEVKARDQQGGNIQPTSSKGMDVFFEPALTGRVGYRYVKFQFQTGLSIPLDSEPHYDYQPFMFSVGLHIDISSAP